MELVSKDLLATILAKVPFSKAKLAAQCVSKTWQRHLQNPAAHSEDVVLQEGGRHSKFCDYALKCIAATGRPGLAQSFLDALSTMRLGAESNLGWLESLPRLRALDIYFLQQGCPAIPTLRYLRVRNYSPLQETFSQLEFYECSHSLTQEDAEGLFQELSGLPSIRIVSVEAEYGITNFSGPPGCRVHYVFDSIFTEFDEPEIHVPVGMAAHLPTLTLKDALWFVSSEEDPEDAERMKFFLDLGDLGGCTLLEEVTLEFGMGLFEGRGVMIEVVGLGLLPGSVREVRVISPFPVGLVEIRWELAPGWMISMKDKGPRHQGQGDRKDLVLSRI